ncbi:MAG: hypothetical protein JO299_04505, partial [Gammaproteobacteria bacterium]|nr:hypothetical protein [Gammaproteobacteria bacterium]
MNAAIDTLSADSPAVAAEATAAGTSGVTRDLAAPATAGIDESSIARAMEAAERSARPAYEVLAEASGLSGERYAQALAQAFDYRFIPALELNGLQPDFSVLPPADATRRRCVVVHEGERLVAIFTDPFDQALRGWLELRVRAPLEWALAGRDELAHLVARCAESLRAIDSV